MSNARILASTINSSSEIVVPSGGVNFGTSTDGTGTVTGGVLDDYEEGTFSFSVRSTTTSGTGYYTKIGEICHINMAFNGTAGTNPDNNIYLPFTHTGADITVGNSSFPTVNGAIAYGRINSGSNSMVLFDPTVGNTQPVIFYLSFTIRVI